MAVMGANEPMNQTGHEARSSRRSGPAEEQPAGQAAADAAEMGQRDIADIRKITDEEWCALAEFEDHFGRDQQQYAQPKPGGFVFVLELNGGEQNQGAHGQSGKSGIALKGRVECEHDN